MKVLVVGGGGREHAICWKLSQSPRVTELLCAPGNGGIEQVARCIPDVKATDLDGVLKLCRDEKVDFVVVAPDDPLALGMVDMLTREGIPAFGPTQSAARMESSKIFSKNLMKKYGIPTAAYETFDDAQAALDYVAIAKTPIVIKADGLALGKGVIIAKTNAEAADAVRSMMLEGAFKQSGKRVVIEEFMSGRECTVLCFCDEHAIVPMPSSQDHKRALDNDEGLNTGGMGAVAPTPFYDKATAKRVYDEILKPTLDAMNAEGLNFRGVLYAGLMLTSDGPKVVEYNARFGDPETQAVLPLLKTDLMDIFEAVSKGELEKVNIEWRDDASAACVVLASGGYPVKYHSGYEITGIDAAEKTGAKVFHAGTKQDGDKLLTAGGRVLGVTALADTLPDALKAAYAAAEKISFKDMHMRHDIGANALRKD